MKLLKIVFAALVLLTNLLIAQPSFADPGKFVNSADYTEVTTAIDALIQAKNDPDAETSIADIQQKFANLQLQKYILESSEESATCRNATGKTLGVYLKSKKAPAAQPGTLYYLGSGQTTDDDYTCTGVYLPQGTQVAFSPLEAVQELTDAAAIRIVQGTQLTVNSDPTGIVSFNVPAAQILKAGDANWSIPALAQADIDAQAPNAPQD